MTTLEKVDHEFETLRFFLHPLDAGDFIENIWTQRIQVVGREARHYFAELMTFRDLDSFLNRSMTLEHVIMVDRVQGTLGTARENSKTLSGLFEEFSKGISLYIPAAHQCARPLAERNNQLSCELGFSTQLDLRVLPLGWASSTKMHMEHETFLLQTVGDMTWCFQEQEKEPVTLGLQQGDSAYLPKGTKLLHHEVNGGAGITIFCQVKAPTYGDLLREAVKAVAEKQVAFRKALPAGMLLSDVSPEILAAGIAENLLPKLNELDWTRAKDQLLFQTMGDINPLPDGHFPQLRKAWDIDENTLVTRRPGMVGATHFKDGDVIMQFPGDWQSGPEKMFLAAEFILEQKTFRVKDIPGWYTAEEKILWVQHLIRKGFLKMLEP